MSRHAPRDRPNSRTRAGIRRAARRENSITLTEMKKTTAITLTLLSAAAMAACGGGRDPERVLAGYRDPRDTTRTSSTPRGGFVPYYRTVYHRRGYNGSGGSYGGSGYRGGKGGQVGGVSRGGFGGIGGGHAAGS